MAAFVVLAPANAQASDACQSKRCEARVAKRKAIHRHYAYCSTWRCVWRQYRRNPMPACTWVGESGGDYRARNPASTAGGKYQFLDGTWHGVGGYDYPGAYDGAQAPPVEQERLARRLLRRAGTRPWVNC